MIGIVILNYNTWDETEKCINSIFKYTERTEFHIIIVDNASPIKIKHSQFERMISRENVEIIFSKENKGYAAGNNIGLAIVKERGYEAALICNSDILFTDNTIDILMKNLADSEGIGLLGPQIYNLDDEFQPIYMLSKLTALGKIKNMLLSTPMKILFKNFERKFIRREEILSPLKVFGVSGCCFLISKSCLDYIYPLDENTFLYEEEYILGVKLENSKFTNYIIPDTHVIHAHGISTKGMTEFSYKCFVKSEQYYMKEYLHTNIFLRGVLFFIRVITMKKRLVRNRL